jgi:dienelactone hydrolase
LEGVVVYDDSKTGKRPGVIIVHDWRGITDTTRKRAEMIAQLGYVAFAADIYGKGVRPTNPEGWGEEAGKYKGDRILFRQRGRAAYDAVRKLPQVDPKKIAAIGYCFGGTGVIEMARGGLPLRGVVSFHGGLDRQPLTPGAHIKGAILALCGADDPYQKKEDLDAFEQQLREEKADYQLVFYGHAVHAFTDPDVDAMGSPGARYNAKADRRSWMAMKDFLEEVFSKDEAKPVQGHD